MPDRARCVCVASVLLWLCLAQGHTSERHPASWWLDRYGSEVPEGSDTTYPSTGTSQADSNSLHGREGGPRPCRVTGERYGVYPQGFSVEGARGILFLPLFDGAQLSETACLEKCCALGPLRCQYLWFFRRKCIAVACNPYQSFYCNYSPVPSHIPSSDSKCISVQYGSGEDDLWQSVSAFSLATTTPTSTIAEGTMSSLRNQPPEVGIVPSDVVTQDSEVVLSARLSDDQEAVEYSWELVIAEPPVDQVLMSFTKSSSVLLSSLSPGVYTVQLTVRDKATGLTGSATTTVTVLPATSSPPLAVGIPHTSSSSVADSTHSETEPGHPPPTKTSKSHLQVVTTKIDQTMPKQATATSYSTPLPPTPALAQAAPSSNSPSTDGDYSLYVKVGVPVLSIVMFILVVSGCIVAISSCFLIHGQREKKYRYRRLIYTDT